MNGIDSFALNGPKAGRAANLEVGELNYELLMGHGNVIRSKDDRATGPRWQRRGFSSTEDQGGVAVCGVQQPYMQLALAFKLRKSITRSRAENPQCIHVIPKLWFARRAGNIAAKNKNTSYTDRHLKAAWRPQRQRLLDP